MFVNYRQGARFNVLVVQTDGPFMMENLDTDRDNCGTYPANCGACGHACNFGAGQPCIEGKCLMVECDAGATK